MRTTLFAACIALLASAGVNGLTIPRTDIRTTVTPLPTRNIYQFPKGTWLENLAVRQNGQVLVTLLSAPEIYQLDPFHTNSSPVLINRIPKTTGVLGIVELQQDVFYVIAGNWSTSTFTSTNGSYSIWKIDLQKGGPQAHGSAHSPAAISKVADIPEGWFLNGLAVLNQAKGLVVVGDSEAGVVYTLNVKTGAYAKTIDDPTMKPGSNPIFPGINGMKIRGDYLYYATSGQAIFSRIPINSADGTATGAAQIIAKNVTGDDFAFDTKGNAYVGGNTENTVSKISAKGIVTVVAGNLNSTLVAGATATAFGRTQKDQSVLYVTTTGGIPAPVNGTIVEGGKLVAIYT